jgi:Tol biopolymer transport system component
VRAAGTAKELVAHPVDLKIRNLGSGINSDAHDYCPLVTADGNTMYYTSRREGSLGNLKDASGRAFEDIYTASCTDGKWGIAMNAGRPLNTAGMDATVGLSRDGNEMIIYRADANALDGDLYLAAKELGTWKAPLRMTDAINGPYHDPSATLSADGTEIYFTSDRQVASVAATYTASVACPTASGACRSTWVRRSTRPTTRMPRSCTTTAPRSSSAATGTTPWAASTSSRSR